MKLVVEGLTTDAAEIRLRQGDIQATAESRLRSARLYSDDPSSRLYVHVNVSGPAFSILVQYGR